MVRNEAGKTMWRQSVSVAVLISLLALQPASARSLADITKEGVLRIGVIGEGSSLNSVKDGKRAGFEVDVFDQIAKSMRLKTVWVPVQNDNLKASLDKGTIDLTVALDNEKSALPSGLTTTNPYYCSGGVFLSKSREFKSSNDLPGKKVALQSGNQYFSYVKRLALENSVSVKQDAASAVLSLIYNTSDVAIVDKIEALNAVNTYPKANLKVSYPLWNTKHSAVIRNQDISLAQAFNSALKKSLDNGAYLKLSQKHFPDSVQCRVY